MFPRRSGASRTFLWQLLFHFRPLNKYMWALGLDVTAQPTMMANRDKLLTGLSPMWRNIFCLGMFFNIFSFLRAFFLFQVLGNFNWPQFGLVCPTIPQWWHVGRLLSVECSNFTGVVLSFLQETIIALPLSFWGFEPEGFTNTVLEVETMLEESVATYSRPV